MISIPRAIGISSRYRAVSSPTPGLYAHEGRTYLPVEDGHYQVQAAQTGDDFRLIHPDGESRYAPRIRHNGEGAWVHEFEQPQTWDRSTLLRRLGPVSRS
jgi:hypothetical protein